MNKKIITNFALVLALVFMGNTPVFSAGNIPALQIWKPFLQPQLMPIVPLASSGKTKAAVALSIPVTSSSKPKVKASALTASVISSVSVPQTSAKEEVFLDVQPDVQPPSGSLAIAGAQIVPFTNVKFTAVGGDVTVNNFTIQQTGLASDSVFFIVGILKDGALFATPNGLNVNHQYSPNMPFTISKGQTVQIAICGNIAYSLAGLDGQQPALSLMNVDASVPVKGTFPIKGATYTTNAAVVLGSLTATLGAYDPRVEKNIYLNTPDVIFSGVRLQAGNTEPVLLKYFTWKQDGSVSSDDLTNLKMYVDANGVTTSYDSILIDPVKRAYFTDFGNGLVIAKGSAVEVYIKGDVGPHASGKTINFNINLPTDILAYGLDTHNLINSFGIDTLGYAAEGQFALYTVPYFHGFVHTVIPGGIINISK